jgi:hypothetical protein
MKKIKILSIEKLEDKRRVYDLTVVGNHIFYRRNTNAHTQLRFSNTGVTGGAEKLDGNF